ncbi:MAG: PspC domain-containing protein [Eubacteriaceae bacterium]|nr:PspC domain-containing protein [Eubacteriaceae bacterium]
MNIYKSVDKMLGGVCSGFAEKLGIEAAAVRIGFLLMCIVWPYMVLVYFSLAIIMPEKEDTEDKDTAVPMLSPSRVYLATTIAACLACGVAIARYLYGIRLNTGIYASFLLMASGICFIFDALTLKALKSPRVFLGAISLWIGLLLSSTLFFAARELEFDPLNQIIEFMGPAIATGVFVNLVLPSRKATVAIWVILAVFVAGFAYLRLSNY